MKAQNKTIKDYATQIKVEMPIVISFGVGNL